MSAIDTSKETSEPVELHGAKRSLKGTLEKLRAREADRDHVQTGRLAAERLLLENLADELQPVFDDVDPADDRFEFSLSAGQNPRLWIDQTAFVAIGRDGRTYRMYKDTRSGRMVLSETADLDQTADLVAEYIAERILAREQMIDTDVVPLKILREAQTAPTRVASLERRQRGGARRLTWFLLGAVCSLGAAVLALLFYTSAAL